MDENIRKRKRDVLSCNDCRRRKLKCDRSYPVCGRCQKGGLAESCTYNSNHQEAQDDEIYASADERSDDRLRTQSGSIENPAHILIPKSEMKFSQEKPRSSTASSTSMLLTAQANTIKQLENRVALLEAMMTKSITCAQPQSEPDVIVKKSLSSVQNIEEMKEPEMSFFKGRAFKTQFFGPSHPAGSLAYFPEVRNFMSEVMPNATLANLRKESKILTSRDKIEQAKAMESTHDSMLSLVPGRAIADSFIQLYLDTFETTYRILHIPTFLKEYSSFWESPEYAGQGFLAVLLMVMATVRCLLPNDPPSFVSSGSSSRAQAVPWIQACDSWLQKQSNKHRVIAVYQVRCLRILAALTSGLNAKETYQNTETLLVYFKAAGFHREPSLLDSKCSPFEQEMRRRLWATIVELEFQASVDRGMASSLTTMHVNCRRPLNINDDSFGHDSRQLPPPIPSSEYTATSFLHISSNSLSLRTSLCSLINDPRSNLQYEDVLRYEQKIMQALEEIPCWPENGLHASILLDLQLRQFLLMLHTPFAARRTKSSQYRYSRIICFETSAHILDQHSKLTSSGNFALCLSREDVFRAALSICHNTFLTCLTPNDIFFQTVKAAFSELVGKGIGMLEERILRPGKGFHYLWWISVACTVVQQKLDPPNSDVLKLGAIDRVAKLYHKVLAYQEGTSRMHVLSTAANLQRSDSGCNNVPGISLFTPDLIAGANQEFDGQFDDPYFLDPSNWTFDNLWSFDIPEVL